VTLMPVLRLGVFQIVWLSCAIGAGYGVSWPGIMAAGLLVTVHLASASQRDRAALTVLAAAVLGALAESLLVAIGLISYSAQWPTPMLAPAWIVALWLAFGATLETTRRLLEPHALLKSFLLGLVLGPMSYWAGERLGALQVSQAAWRSYLAIAMLWGVAFPALLAVDGRRVSPA
jgi:hypothetical protein